MYKTIVFDLDGTLLDTLGDLAMAGNRTLQALDFPTHEVESYKRMVGNGVDTLVRRMLPAAAGDATFAIARALFEKNYARYRNDTTAPYPGIVEMLGALREAGVQLGVLSNKPDQHVQPIVDGFFPGLFDREMGLREGFEPKPDPTSLQELLFEMGAAAHETLYVGDSDVDVYTAHNAQLACCGVSWGFRGREELAAAGADFLIDSPAELPGIVRRDGGE